MSAEITIIGDSVTWRGFTQEGTRVGAFLVHKGFSYEWQRWAVTAPNGSTAGYYRTKRDAIKAAKAIQEALTDHNWHTMAAEEPLTGETRTRAIEAIKAAGLVPV